MKFTGLDVFDSTIQRTNVWLKELMQELNWSDHRKTYLAFRCVLHGVRDHLSFSDAIAFGEELPLLIKGLYFDHWDTAGKPLALSSHTAFLSHLSQCISRELNESVNAESIARAVFRLLDKKVTDGEIHEIHHLLPTIVLELWPPTLRAA
jgi:uncharacterized protein (DUF2267 family)